LIGIYLIVYGCALIVMVRWVRTPLRVDRSTAAPARRARAET